MTRMEKKKYHCTTLCNFVVVLLVRNEPTINGRYNTTFYDDGVIVSLVPLAP